MIGIYQILNIVNNKRYIGSSVNIIKRFKQHLTELKCNRHTNIRLSRAWIKYGQDSFKFEIVEECEEDSLIEREEFYINLYGINKESIYNIDRIVRGRRVLSELTRNKISIAKKGQTPWIKGKKMPPSWNSGTVGVMKPNHTSFKKGLVPHNKGIPMNENMKNRISKSKTGIVSWNKGIPASKEAREKMSLAKRGIPVNRQKVNKYLDLSTNNVCSSKEIIKTLGISLGTFYARIRNNNKTTLNYIKLPATSSNTGTFAN